jgi:hypothetical protein
MNVQNEIYEEYKLKLTEKLIEYKELLVRKARLMNSIIDDLEQDSADADFCYKLVEQTNLSTTIKSKKIQEYIVLMAKQLQAVQDTYAEQENNSSKDSEEPENNTEEKESSKNNNNQPKKSDTPSKDFETELDDFDDI